jgi:hypothetical protein
MRAAMLCPVVVMAAAVLVTGCSASQETKPAGQSTSNRPTGVPGSTVEVVTDLQLNDDRTVSWVDAKFEQSKIGDEIVVPISGGTHRSAEFAPDGLLLTPEGCKPPFGDIRVDADGLGGVPCTWADFAKQDLYAPKIWFGQDGRVSKIASRYHP